MKRFHLKSSKFEGYVEYQFNEGILLTTFDMSNAELAEAQHIWLLKNLPRDLAELYRLAENKDTITITEVPLIITFDMFWDKYDNKDCSSKIRTAKAFNKMSNAEQAAAYMYIEKYFRKIPAGTVKKYAETYLNAQLWNN